MQLTKEIKSKNDFIDFLKNLEADSVNNIEEWENVNITDFLEALSAWLNDTDTVDLMNSDAVFLNNSKPTENLNWQFFAEALIAAKYYE